MRTRKADGAVSSAVEPLIEGRWEEDSVEDVGGQQVIIRHGLVASPIQYHRATRVIADERGRELEIPRRKSMRGREHYLYDLLLVERGTHLIVAIPFHAFAKSLFVKVDRALAVTRTSYETL